MPFSVPKITQVWEQGKINYAILADSIKQIVRDLQVNLPNKKLLEPKMVDEMQQILIRLRSIHLRINKSPIWVLRIGLEDKYRSLLFTILNELYFEPRNAIVNKLLIRTYREQAEIQDLIYKLRNCFVPRDQLVVIALSEVDHEMIEFFRHQIASLEDLEKDMLALMLKTDNPIPFYN